MKQILVILVIAMIVVCLSACHSGNAATADQATLMSTMDMATPDQPEGMYTKDPSQSYNFGKNDDPDPGPYCGNN